MTVWTVRLDVYWLCISAVVTDNWCWFLMSNNGITAFSAVYMSDIKMTIFMQFSQKIAQVLTYCVVQKLLAFCYFCVTQSRMMRMLFRASDLTQINPPHLNSITTQSALSSETQKVCMQWNLVSYNAGSPCVCVICQIIILLEHVHFLFRHLFWCVLHVVYYRAVQSVYFTR